MSAFEERDPRRYLSPVRVEPRPVGLPYGLTWDELRSSLPELAAATELRAHASHAIRGLHGAGKSCILTLGYPGKDGAACEVIIFVKQIDNVRQAESAKYAYLAANGMPLPTLLRAFPRDEGEVLVLEFLSTLGTGPEEADDLLALIARLNAVVDPPSGLFRPTQALPKVEFEGLVHKALSTVAADVAGPNLDPARWLETYRQVGHEVAALPVALNHAELHFQQVGWSTAAGRRRLVMFDLATMALLPGLTDVAAMLRPLSTQTSRDERELFASYRASLTHPIGGLPDEDQAWHDLCLTRIVRSFESLPWVLSMDDHEDRSETSADVVELLWHDFGEVDLL